VPRIPSASKRLLILQILPTFGVGGGAETMASHLMLGLAQAYDVVGASLYPARGTPIELGLKQAGIPVRDLGKRRGFDPKMYFAIDKLVRTVQPDVVHTHLSVLRYVFPVLLRRRVPLAVHTLHNLAEHEADAVGRAVHRLAFRGTVLPVAISRECGASFRRVYGRECHSVIPNCIPVDHYRRDVSGRAEWRRKYGFDSSSILFVCVGRLEPQKNPLLLVQAFAALRDPRAHLLLLGEGSLREQVAASVRSHGLEQSVHLLGKRLDIPQWLGASDVFVLSSDWEGNPLSVMEAMAAGLPVVSTSVGGVPELVEPGQHGFLVPPGDSQGLTAAMRRFLENPELMRVMGDTACAHAVKAFRVERMVHNYARLYESALADPRRLSLCRPPKSAHQALPPRGSGAMRIVFVTAKLPHGTDEAFFVPEVKQLERIGHQVLIVPRSPVGPVIHAQELLRTACCESLYSGRVLKAAVAILLRAPVRTAAAAWSLRGSRSLAVDLKNLAIVPKALWLANLASQWRADHIHCHWAGTTATMAMLASRVSGIPWSFTTHRWDIVENNLLAAKVRNASFARFISEDGLRIARELGVETGENVRVLHMGISIPRSVGPRAQGNQVVLCPARLVEVKGHRFLLEAWRILRDRGVDAVLKLAGQGELRPQLEAFAEALGLGDRVRFLGGVPHHQLMNLYEESWAVVVPSLDLGNGLHEGIPVALMEAMSRGVSVVATRTGGIPELLSPGTGLLVPPRDSMALADAIQSVLEDAGLRESLGLSGRKRVMQAYDIVEVVSELSCAMGAARQPKW
jgi:glycosyltransferase involved in cell wall biosynthesis